jgi:hypothetical protein
MAQRGVAWHKEVYQVSGESVIEIKNTVKGHS